MEGLVSSPKSVWIPLAQTEIPVSFVKDLAIGATDAPFTQERSQRLSSARLAMDSTLLLVRDLALSLEMELLDSAAISLQVVSATGMAMWPTTDTSTTGPKETTMITEIGDQETTIIDKEEDPIILTMTPTEALETQAKEAIEGMIEDHIPLSNNKEDILHNNNSKVVTLNNNK
jgi:hypothetical protein